MQVTPVDASGGYYRLDDVTLDGGGHYWTSAAGLTIRAASHVAFDASIQYVGMGDASTTTAHAGNVKVSMSAIMIGVSLDIVL